MLRSLGAPTSKSAALPRNSFDFASPTAEARSSLGADPASVADAEEALWSRHQRGRPSSHDGPPLWTTLGHDRAQLKVAEDMCRLRQYTVAAIATGLGGQSRLIYRHLDTAPTFGNGLFEEAMMAAHCLFCGSTAGPFNKVEGPFAVLICADCWTVHGHGSGPYPVVTRAEMRRAGPAPDLGSEQKAAANRQVIAATRRRLAAGEQVPPMYQVPGLAWLERQADGAGDLVAERQAQRGPTGDAAVSGAPDAQAARPRTHRTRTDPQGTATSRPACRCEHASPARS